MMRSIFALIHTNRHACHGIKVRQNKVQRVGLVA